MRSDFEVICNAPHHVKREKGDIHGRAIPDWQPEHARF